MERENEKQTNKKEMMRECENERARGSADRERARMGEFVGERERLVLCGLEWRHAGQRWRQVGAELHRVRD